MTDKSSVIKTKRIPVPMCQFFSYAHVYTTGVVHVDVAGMKSFLDKQMAKEDRGALAEENDRLKQELHRLKKAAKKAKPVENETANSPPRKEKKRSLVSNK